jgi:hypothetical protein
MLLLHDDWWRTRCVYSKGMPDWACILLDLPPILVFVCCPESRLGNMNMPKGRAVK